MCYVYFIVCVINTVLYQDSLGGNTKTVMIANIGPADYNFDETISTLRFAQRAKQIQNKPTINEDAKDTTMRQYNDEIQRLKKALADAGNAVQSNDDDIMNNNLSLDSTLPRQFGPVTLNGRKVIVDKIVEKVIQEGVTDDDVAKLSEEQKQQLHALEQQYKSQYNDIQQRALQVKQQTEHLQQTIKDKMYETELRRQQRIDMEHKLQQIEQQMVVGKTIDQTIHKTKQNIEQNKLRLIQEQQHQLDIQRSLQEKQIVQNQLIQQYENIDNELQNKNTKLQQLYSKYTDLKNTFNNIQADIQNERNTMLDSIRDLYKDISYKDYVLNNFVINYNENEWIDKFIWHDALQDYELCEADINSIMCEPLPYSIKLDNNNMPISDFTLQQRMSSNNDSARWFDNNITQLKLYIPDRITIELNELQDDNISSENYNRNNIQVHNNRIYDNNQYNRPSTSKRMYMG